MTDLSNVAHAGHACIMRYTIWKINYYVVRINHTCLPIFLLIDILTIFSLGYHENSEFFFLNFNTISLRINFLDGLLGLKLASHVVNLFLKLYTNCQASPKSVYIICTPSYNPGRL